MKSSQCDRAELKILFSICGTSRGKVAEERVKGGKVKRVEEEEWECVQSKRHADGIMKKYYSLL